LIDQIQCWEEIEIVAERFSHTLCDCSFFFQKITLFCFKEKLTQLIGADDKRFGSRPLRFVNDVDVLDGRYLFFTDSDWLYPRKEFMSVLLRSNPRGR
jgi:hypothetical protein